MSAIDDAIARLQDLAEACTDQPVKFAPDYPIENAAPCPFSIAYLASGEATPQNGTSERFNPVVHVDFLFSRTDLTNSYKQINKVAAEYPKRVCGDPTLNGKVCTVNYPISFEVAPTEWNGVTLLLLSFSIPLKTLETPITTA